MNFYEALVNIEKLGDKWVPITVYNLPPEQPDKEVFNSLSDFLGFVSYQFFDNEIPKVLERVNIEFVKSINILSAVNITVDKEDTQYILFLDSDGVVQGTLEELLQVMTPKTLQELLTFKKRLYILQ